MGSGSTQYMSDWIKKKTQSGGSESDSETRTRLGENKLGDEPSLDPLYQDLTGSMRQRNDAAANQAIGSISQRAGGDVSSPLFQLLSTNAKTGSAAQTGAAMSQLRLQGEESRAGRQLQREMTDASQALQIEDLLLRRKSLDETTSLNQQRLDLGEQAQNTNTVLQQLSMAKSTNYEDPMGQAILGALNFGVNSTPAMTGSAIGEPFSRQTNISWNGPSRWI